MKENDRRKFLFLVTEKCEAVDPDVRLMAARVLLYLVQGTLTGYSVKNTLWKIHAYINMYDFYSQVEYM